MSAPPESSSAEHDLNPPQVSSTSSDPIVPTAQIERAVQRATQLTSSGHRGNQSARLSSGETVRTRGRSSTVSSGSEVLETAQQQEAQQLEIQQQVLQQVNPERTRGATFSSRPPLPVALRPVHSPLPTAAGSSQPRPRLYISRYYAYPPDDPVEEARLAARYQENLEACRRRRPPGQQYSEDQVEESTQNPPPSPRPPSTPKFTFNRSVTPVSALLTQFPLLGIDVPVTLTSPQTPRAGAMSYQNYLDSPQGIAGSNPRQAPPSPSQNMAQATNGINGGMAMNGGGAIGHPTPAGHQSDLNYVYAMVEELSNQLAINREFTDRITEHMGKIRAKAMNMDLTNDELIAAAAEELNETSKNLEKENSDLRKKLEKAEYDVKENMKLAIYGANILSDIKDKMHKYKEQHEHDTLAWHKSYRNQLADERQENLNLRNEINDKIAAAARANGHLRDLRRYLTDHDELHELRVQNIALRQERRWWKRMAMPMIPDDDSEWSDDDDLIDPEEKKRLAALKAEKEKAEKEAAAAEEGPSPTAT